MIMIFRGIYMKIPYVFKKCTKCGRWLVASTVNFYKHKVGKHGLRGECKECRNKQNKQWYENNREEIAEQKNNIMKLIEIRYLSTIRGIINLRKDK